MKKVVMYLNEYSFLVLLLLLLPFSAKAQSIGVNGSQNSSQTASVTAPSSNNYSNQGSTNSSFVNIGTNLQQNKYSTSRLTSAPGTGEYFLVPVIVRKDPEGSAIRFNNCGTAILLLLDKNALGGLTDSAAQPLTVNTVLKIAESRFRMAAEYQPNNYLYHTNLASALYRQGRIDEALQSLRQAIKLNPNDPTLLDYQERILHVKVTVRVLDDTENK